MEGDLLKTLVDYPFIYKGQLFDGRHHPQLGFCRRCETRDCADFTGKDFKHYTCSKGFSCFPMGLGSEQLVVNGLIAVEHNRNFTGERRKQYKKNAVSEIDVRLCRDNLATHSTTLELIKNQAVKDSVAYLHDIRTSVGVVLSCTEQVVDRAPGNSFEDKLGKVDEQTFSLFQAVNLLEQQLELSDIIANPQAITYGPKYVSSLYGFLHKMVKIFKPRAAERGVDIEMHGHSDSQISAFNSFQFIPLILLDNAVKYSFTGKTIHVTVKDNGPTVQVTVSSFGYVVPDEEQMAIFDKYYRTDAARRQTFRGMGLGLYLGKLIADAHGFTINYRAHGADARGIGASDFYFEVPVA
jgi:signal transduction histidine kinase